MLDPCLAGQNRPDLLPVFQREAEGIEGEGAGRLVSKLPGQEDVYQRLNVDCGLRLRDGPRLDGHGNFPTLWPPAKRLL